MVIYDENGKITRSVGACVDITEHRQSEARAKIRRDLALKLAGRIDKETALSYCLDAAIEISGFDTGVIYILDEKSGDFKAACHHGGSAFLKEHYSALKAGSVDARLIMKGQPLYVTAGEFTPPFDEQLRPEGFTFDATIPVVYQGRVIASLGILSHTQNNLPAIIRDSLEAIAADIGIIIDRISSRQALQDSEEKYRLVVENARETIIVAQDGMMKFANQITARMTGYREEELSSIPFVNLIHPDDRELVIDRHLRRLKGEVFEEVYPFRVVRSDGQLRWAEIQAVLIEWEGRPATLNFLTDITERKLAEEALKQSEEKYRTILDEMDEAYYELDAKGNYTFVNNVVCRQSGYSREELLGLNYKAYTPPEERKRIIEAYSSVFSTGIPRRWVPLTNISKDGSRIYLEDSIYPLRNESGEIIGLRGLSRDVTGRVKAEKDIQQRAALLDSAYDSIIAYDLDGKIIYANQTACSIRGFSRDEMLAMNMRQLVPVEELPGLEECHRHLLEQGELSSEAVHIRKDGSTFIVDTHLRLADPAGDKLVIAVQRDITLRKQMENQLVESEAKYRSLVDTSASGIAIAEESDNLVLVNDRLCDMFGYSRDEVLGKQFLDFIHPEEREKIAADFFEALSSSKTLPMLEFRGVRKDGTTIWLFTTPNPLKIGERLTGFSVVFQDITQLKQSETALKESEQRYRSLFQHNPAMVYALDRQARFTSINAAAVRISGYSEEEAVRMNFSEVIAPEYLEILKQNYARTLNGEPQSYETVMIAKDGRKIDIHITSTPIIIEGNVIGAYGIAEDISGRKQMERQLNSSRQMLKLVLDTIPQRVFWKDENFKYLGCNRPFASDAGLADTEAIVGKDDFELVWKEFAQLYRDDDKLVMETGKAKFNYEEPEARPEGNRFRLRTNKVPLYDPEGRVMGVLGTYEDITPSKRGCRRL